MAYQPRELDDAEIVMRRLCAEFRPGINPDRKDRVEYLIVSRMQRTPMVEHRITSQKGECWKLVDAAVCGTGQRIETAPPLCCFGPLFNTLILKGL